MDEYVCLIVPAIDADTGVIQADFIRRERIVRCRDCKHAVEHCDTEKLDCTHFSQWDYYEDEPGHWPVEPDGFCAWGEPRLERGGMEPPTERQLDFIESIQETLGIEFDGTTKAEASEWIDEHIGAYKLETADPFSIEHGYF